jgi:hypothetical protein
LVASGIIEELKSALKITLSAALSPIVIVPPNTTLPLIYALPVNMISFIGAVKSNADQAVLKKQAEEQYNSMMDSYNSGMYAQQGGMYPNQEADSENPMHHYLAYTEGVQNIFDNNQISGTSSAPQAQEGGMSPFISQNQIDYYDSKNVSDPYFAKGGESTDIVDIIDESGKVSGQTTLEDAENRNLNHKLRPQTKTTTKTTTTTRPGNAQLNIKAHGNYGPGSPFNRRQDTSIQYDLHNRHLCKQDTEPLPRMVIDYGSTKIALYTHTVAAFVYYHRKCLELAGFMDEDFNENAWEHVEHTYRIIKAGLHPPFWWFADLADSENLISSQKGAIENSSIATESDKPWEQQEWAHKVKRGSELYKQKHGHYPNQPPYTPREQVINILKQLKNDYIRK